MRARRKSKIRRPRPSYYFRLFQLLIILSCFIGIYLLWLDIQIRREFDGKKWSLPARVYASPVELYPGQAMTRSVLQDDLLALGYEPNGRLQQSGQFTLQPDSLSFVTRPVAFWAGEQESRSIRIEFQDQRIRAIRDLKSGDEISVTRLEPELIGKIYPQHNEDRILVHGDEIPDFLIHALLAVEDRRFYQHHGIDIRGLARALIANIRRGRISQGGSTLTQQLVKNFFLSPERTIWRKLNEMAMAVLLESHYSKSEILTAYINEIYLGQHGARSIHGFGTAAEYYFGRPLNELRNDQLALLVALVRGASYYNPRRHPDRARQRRDLVLDSMVKQGYLSSNEAKAAEARALDVAAKPTWTNARYPAFLDLVRRQLLRDYKMDDLRNEGLKIITTLNADMQKNAQRRAGLKLKQLERERGLPSGKLQMATVVLQIGTGDVLAVIGGRDTDMEGFNRALDARRQIGSLIKPLIYLAALSSPDKYNLLTRIDDKKVAIPQDDGTVWEPKNFDREEHGQVYLYEALEHSYNLASVRLGMQVGLDKVIDLLHKAGIKDDISKYPSLLLGSLGLTPLEVAQIYQTLANGGFQVPLNSISSVLDSNNKPLQRYGLEVNQAMDPDPIFLVDHILSAVVNDGTARSLKTTLADRLPLAGKTGTTNDLRDSWFAGFGDNLLAVTWLGYDNNRPTPFTGAAGALQVWSAVMKRIDIQPVKFIAPEDIRWLTRKHGWFSGRGCPDMEKVPYISNYEPQYRRACYSNE